MTEPAFACASDKGYQSGMSLRDYFAGQAMIAYISYPEKHTCRNHEQMAEVAYAAADAMMEARKIND